VQLGQGLGTVKASSRNEGSGLMKTLMYSSHVANPPVRIWRQRPTHFLRGSKAVDHHAVPTCQTSDSHWLSRARSKPQTDAILCPMYWRL